MQLLINLAASRHFKALCFYSLALLGTTAFTFVAWSILSATIRTPSPTEILSAFGFVYWVLDAIKPEPVENYTFLLSTVFGMGCFGIAGYWSVAKTGKSNIAIKLSPLISILMIIIWFSLTKWNSIYFSNNLLIAAAIAHSKPFWITAIVLAALIWLASKLEHKHSYLSLLIGLPVVLIFSNLVLTTTDDSIVIGGHYEIFIYPIIQDWLGQGIHLTQKSLYGMYPIFLRPLWNILGAPSIVLVSSAMAVLLFASNLATLVFMYKFSRHKTMGIIFGLAAITCMLLSTRFWPTDIYFQFMPLRLVFPALAMAFIVFPFTRLHYPFIAYSILAFGLTWNFESGLVGLITFGIFQCASQFSPNWQIFSRTCFKQFGFALLAISFSVFCICIYYEYRFGAIPKWDRVVLILKAFNAGLGAEPMPMYGLWMAHVLIYSVAIFIGIKRIFLSINDKSNLQAAALLAFAAMGLMWLRYYQGRSVDVQLMFVSWPAICCLGILLDILISSMPKYSKAASTIIAIAIGAPLLAGILIWTWNDPFPKRGLTHMVHDKNDSPINAHVDKIISKFNSIKFNPEDRIIVVSRIAYLIQMKLGVPSPINVNNMQLAFESEVENLASSIKDSNTKMIVIQERQLLDHPRIKPLLSSLFDQSTLSEEGICTITSMEEEFIYVRRNTDPDTRLRHVEVDSNNIALGKLASDSGALGTASASAAVDGLTGGNFQDGSVTHTTFQPNPWWQVDLGSSVPIDSVQIWNRTDCCLDRLRGYWIFVSEKPFGANQKLDDLKKRSDIVKSFQVTEPCPTTTVRFPQTHGRYVRVQLEGPGFISLAEVKVFSSSPKILPVK